MNDGLSVADVFAMSRNGEGNGSYGNGAWDNPFIYLVWLALLGNGGIFGNRGFGGSGTGSCGCTPSCSDLYAGFNNQDVMGQLRGITNGICDGFYAINTGLLQGFNGVGNGIANLGYQMGQGFCGVDRGILNSNFINQAGFNSINSEIASCCCDIRNLIGNSTRDIIDSNNSNTRAILDFLTTDKISTLTAENQALKFAASQSAQNAFITANQEAQTAELIRRLGRDVPVPAYVVPNPNCCYGGAWGASYNSGCGCGCG